MSEHDPTNDEERAVWAQFYAAALGGYAAREGISPELAAENARWNAKLGLEDYRRARDGR